MHLHHIHVSWLQSRLPESFHDQKKKRGKKEGREKRRKERRREGKTEEKREEEEREEEKRKKIKDTLVRLLLVPSRIHTSSCTFMGEVRVEFS